MSGIAGIIHFDGKPATPGMVEAMTSSMAHRGPDGISHWRKGAAALGQCMLRTTPESLEERQPLANEDESLVLVMDGRVDNWEELRRELLGRGAALRDRSDAELVLRAYETWGGDCLERIDGDFALAVWDAGRQEAFCARDRMGHKPLHYHWDGNTLSFASEVRALLALPWVRREPNEDMLAGCLSWQWRSKNGTLWRGILRLEAAHRMAASGREPQPEPYWAPDLSAPPPFRKDEEYYEHHRELLADLVRRLSRSHRPVSVEVSGGLDSSAVFCIAERLRRDGRLPAPAIEGYTLAFAKEDGEAYELPYARAVGDYLGVPIHEIPPVRPPPEWFMERARIDRDLPAFPNWTMTLGIHQQAAARGSRVLLSGLGGDQWMAGCRDYYAEELAQGHWRMLLDCFRADAKESGLRQAATWFLRHGCFPLLPPALQDAFRQLTRRLRGNAPSRDNCYWLSPAMRDRARRPAADRPRPRARPGQQALLETLHSALGTLAMEWVDRLAAQTPGIEPRYPLDHPRLVQFAFSTPARLWLRGESSKHLHSQALQGLMPSIILERQTKAVFRIVWDGHLGRMRRALTEEIPRRRQDWVTQEGMRRLFEAGQHDPAANRSAWILWTVYECDGVFSEEDPHS